MYTIDMDQQIEKPKILIVEDNETYRKIVKNALSVAGYQVLEAENGLRGLEIVRTEKPLLVMIDVYMPVMDGMAMLAELKKDAQLLKIPAVMVTNVQEELENAVKAGADEAILKSSLTPRQIIDVCKKYVPLAGQPLPQA